MSWSQLQGDVTGTDADVSMTAFCLIAMQEAGPQCTASVTVSISPSLVFLFLFFVVVVFFKWFSLKRKVEST